jgi:hypothetical protein
MPSSVASRNRSFTTDSARMSCPTSAAAMVRLGIVPHSLGSMRFPAGRRYTETIPSRSGLRKYGALFARRPRELSPVPREVSMLAMNEAEGESVPPRRRVPPIKDGASGAVLSSPLVRLLVQATPASLARAHTDEATRHRIHGLRAVWASVRAHGRRLVSPLRSHPVRGRSPRRLAQPLARGDHRARDLCGVPREARGVSAPFAFSLAARYTRGVNLAAPRALPPIS